MTLLTGKIAVIYGAGGAVGAAVARAFADEGAIVHLRGRHAEPVERVTAALLGGTAGRVEGTARADGSDKSAIGHGHDQAEKMATTPNKAQATAAMPDNVASAAGSGLGWAEGGWAEGAVVDALDELAVEDDLRLIVERHGRIDVTVNLVSVDHVQGVPLLEMSVDDFVLGFEARMRTHFITARAAGRHMARRGSGVILMLTAAPDRTAIPMAGSFGPQCAAVESFSRALAVELGPAGVRVACLRSAGSPDAAGVDEVFDMHAENAGLTRQAFDAEKASRTLLGRLPTLDEVGQVATFLASDRAGAITGMIANVTCGELLD